MKERKTKIIVKHCNEKIEMTLDSPDTTLDEFYCAFKRMAYALGFSPNLIKKAFSDE